MQCIKSLGKTVSEFVQVGLIILGGVTVLGIVGLFAKLIYIPLRFGWNLIG
jgi:preprotein translocase subunit Sss1